MTTTELTGLSHQTLGSAPTRALKFLLGAARSPVIRGLLESRGYSDADQRRGWELLHRIDPLMSASTSAHAPPPQSDATVRDAFVQLDGWDNINLPIADVALRRRQPGVHAYIFAGTLAPTDGVGSIPVVITFLDRVDAIEAVEAPHTGHRRTARADAPAVPDSITAAHARDAMNILAARGITVEERARVRGLITTVQTGTTGATPAGDATVDASLDSALTELYDWVDEWTTIANRVVKRRDLLLQLGIGERKKRKGKNGPPEATK